MPSIFNSSGTSIIATFLKNLSTPPSLDARQRAKQAPRGLGEFRVISTLVVLSAVLVALLYELPESRLWLESLERLTLDALHRNGRKTPVRDDLVVLGIDDASLKLDAAWPEDIEASPTLQAMQKQWPWPRQAWAHILDRLFKAGARQVFMDVTFKSPSDRPENDLVLREALERYRGKVVLGIKYEDSTVGRATATALMLPTPAVTGPNPDTANLGLLTLWPDNDECIRSVHWQVTAAEAEALQSGFATLPNPMDERHPAASLVMARNITPIDLTKLPGSSRIRFCGAGAYRAFSLFEMFIPSMWEANLAKGEVFRGKTVLIGATATDLQDIQKTPLGQIAGVQVHAHAVTALLSKSFVHATPPWFRGLSIVLAALLAWCILYGLRTPILCVMALAAAGFIWQWLCTGCFDWLDVECSSQPFLFGLSLSGMTGLTGNLVLQRRESRKLQRFLTRYTAPEFVDEMLADRAGLYSTLGGVERTVTIFFSDVRGFTSMSENMTPKQVVTQLNQYLSRMVACVFQNRGLVDKFIGDAVMALWGSASAKGNEESYRQNAIQAVTAALAMRKALEELNAGWREEGIGELKFGMGVHQGEVIVGNIGSEAPYEKMDLTVIGDAVNLASRLEGITKQYGVDLIVSESVRSHLRDSFVCRSADLVAVKGKAKPVEVFSVIGPLQENEPAGLAAYENGVLLYRAGNFAEAITAFAKACHEGLNDSLTQMYQQRCDELIRVPPADWTGVYIMQSK
jgi:adenylate cyclase